MLNEKKVILMTKIAISEKNDGKNINTAAKSFKVDFVTVKMMYTFVTTTIGFLVLVGLYVLSNLENLLVNSAEIDFIALGGSVIRYYVLCMVVSLLAAFFFYGNKYDKSFKKVKKEYIDYKNLAKLADK